MSGSSAGYSCTGPISFPISSTTTEADEQTAIDDAIESTRIDYVSTRR
jgi:hypothetical protein